MNIPPFLERLLLSNEAVFKNASLGLSGQNMVFVPQGKTAVLLELSIEPFCNTIQMDTDLYKLFNGGIHENQGIYSKLIQKNVFQIQIINDKYSTYFTLRPEFRTDDNYYPDYLQPDHKTLNFNFTRFREELFIYTDRSMYFNFIYPYRVNDESANTTGLFPVITNPATGFLPKIQNLPDNPITFNKNTQQDYMVRVGVGSAFSSTLEKYYPVGHQTNPAFSPEYPQMEYLHFFNGLIETGFQSPPVEADGAWNFGTLLTIPLVNVKYALLNKRPDDYGITKPL